MRLLRAMICLPCAAVSMSSASAQGEQSDAVVSQFERFCLRNVANVSSLIDPLAAAEGWSPIPFPADFRYDKADVNLAWRGTIEGKPYELLISNVSAKKNNSTLCRLRTPATEVAAAVHKDAFQSTVEKFGLKAKESRPPHVFKYRGKFVNGKSAQAELASAILVRRSDIHGHLPETIYMSLSILY